MMKKYTLFAVTISREILPQFLALPGRIWFSATLLHGVVSDSLGITISQNDISGGASVSNNLCEFVRKK